MPPIPMLLPWHTLAT
ncbi:unnamed protein product [Acanthoscelides obtectus]|uniref:Uncharacterized protein n=1 Tax=Acanthoscelides obtectus TaxID=200917 RepID=A0A9P0QIL7_ACAOB|nr:unnamed protein product [Acanthoscelides obtectus]CAK1684426.1 hypothetical protein AOBTE_LOCUS34856 [Acanthoscelides obtectus]